MKKLQKFSATQLLVISSILCTPAFCSAESLSGNLKESFQHSGQAIKHGATASGQAVSGVVAVPLTLIGAVGKVSADAGEALMDVATDKHKGKKLEITEKNLTIAPSPKDVMKQPNCDTQKVEASNEI